MRKTENCDFEESPSGFSRAADGFGESEFTHGEDVIGGVGLSVGAMQFVAQRQLIGSIVAALLIAVVAGIVALKPVHSLATTAPAHGFVVIQQPTYVTPTDQHFAETKRETELP